MQRATSEGDIAGQSRPAMATTQPRSTSSTSGNSDGDVSEPVDERATVKPAPGGKRQKQKTQPSPTHSTHANHSAKSVQAAQAAQTAQTSQPPQQPQQPAHNPASQSTQKTTSSAAGPSNPRLRGQKHVVGGGGSTARLHARVPSSKALHKAAQHHHHMHHVASTSSAKLPQQRRPLSPSPPPVDFAAQFPFAAPPSATASSSSQHHHRRSTSGSDGTGNGKLARSNHSSSTTSLLRKNASATNLKRNRSTADVTKRSSHGFVVGHGSRPTAQLKRSYSNPAVTDKLRQLQAAKNNANNKASQVRFEIGSPDAQDDEWVDAGSSTFADSHRDSLPLAHHHTRQPSEPIHSRRDEDGEGGHSSLLGAAVSPRQQNHKQKELVLPLRPANGTSNHNYPHTSTGGDNTASGAPAFADEQNRDTRKLHRAASSSSTALHLLASNSKTRLLLPRTPSRGAPPKMSTETASSTTNHPRMSPSDSDSSPSESQLHSQPSQTNDASRSDHQPPSDEPPTTFSGETANGRHDQMTSRFITAGSHESVSGAAGGGSFYASSSSRPDSGRQAADDLKSTASSNTPASVSGLHADAMSQLRRSQSIGDNTTNLTDEVESPVLVAAGSRPATSSGGNPRRTRLQQAPPAELSRTQQKLNLERASSSLDRNARPHQGPAAGPLLGAGGFGIHDPRVGKLMAKAGMEYYVVRRYQNPVTRSLARITARLGDKNRHIPAANGNRPSTAADAAGVSGRTAARSGVGLSQSFRERDIRREAIHHSATAAAGNPGTIPGLSRTRTMPPSSTAAGADTDYGNGTTRSWRLSGTSLVDGEEEDGTAALLRNLWDKNLYLGTSQE